MRPHAPLCAYTTGLVVHHCCAPLLQAWRGGERQPAGATANEQGTKATCPACSLQPAACSLQPGLGVISATGADGRLIVGDVALRLYALGVAALAVMGSLRIASPTHLDRLHSCIFTHLLIHTYFMHTKQTCAYSRLSHTHLLYTHLPTAATEWRDPSLPRRGAPPASPLRQVSLSLSVMLVRELYIAPKPSPYPTLTQPHP